MEGTRNAVTALSLALNNKRMCILIWFDAQTTQGCVQKVNSHCIGTAMVGKLLHGNRCMTVG